LDFLTLGDGTDMLSQNVIKELPLSPAYPRRTEISRQFGDAGCGLFPHGTVQSDQVWHGAV